MRYLICTLTEFDIAYNTDGLCEDQFVLTIYKLTFFWDFDLE